jgi:hypothetical protein
MVLPEITFPLYSMLTSKHPPPPILSSYHKVKEMDFGNIRKQTRRDRIQNQYDTVRKQ